MIINHFILQLVCGLIIDYETYLKHEFCISSCCRRLYK